jgi:hypothetical protein
VKRIAVALLAVSCGGPPAHAAPCTEPWGGHPCAYADAVAYVCPPSPTYPAPPCYVIGAELIEDSGVQLDSGGWVYRARNIQKPCD